MRVAITGASGFVGQHVLRELQSRDLDIIATSRSPEYLLTSHARTKVVQLNMTNELANPFQTMEGPDVLIHLAWDGLPHYQSSRHIEIELPAQLRFLTSCLAAGLKRLVVTGTCFEYGMLEGELLEHAISQPCTQYGIAKDALRKHLEAIKSKHVFQLAWLRLFYLYGEGQSKNSLYASLSAAIARGDTQFDMSCGEQVRDYLSAREAARLIVDIALLSVDTGIVNICSGVPVTVRDQVETWRAAKKSDIRLNLGKLPYSDFEPMSFWGNRSKLDCLLDKS